MADLRRPSPPLLASAILACLYECWALDESDAEKAIASGRITLRPAQEWGAVTPLAAVISPRSALVEVSDLGCATGTAPRAWSLLSSGAGPQLRFGSLDRRVLERMAWRDGPLADCLAAWLQIAPIPLWPLAIAGLCNGDDLHARTSAANAALVAHLQPMMLGQAWRGPELEQRKVAEMLSGSPLFFLTLWMAVCHLLLATAHAPGSTLVVGMAGNGQDLGIRLAGKPNAWFVTPGTAPAGPRLEGAEQAEASPVIGDSGVIDAAGFGGQALAGASEVAEALEPWLPADWRQRPAALLAGLHPKLAGLGLRSALDAAMVGARGIAPLTAIAMLDAAGRKGLLGRGLFVPPVEVFQRAVVAVLGST
ncbi:MAG: YlbE family protein [Thiomonas sp.]